MKRWHVLQGSNLDVLPRLQAESFDSVVCDPPAGIDFMGTDWDRFGSDKREGARGAFVAYMTAVFRECLRILKPGGHLVAWALPRTAHWTAWAVEDAGFEVRDRIHDLTVADKWIDRLAAVLDDHQADLFRRVLESQASPVLGHLYSQGFPKSLDVEKAIDREIFTNPLFEPVRAHLRHWKQVRNLSNKDLNAAIGSSTNGGGMAGHWIGDTTQAEIPSVDQWNKLRAILKWDPCELDDIYEVAKKAKAPRPVIGKHAAAAPGVSFRRQSGTGKDITSAGTPEAACWTGWGTSLKPALEPWIVARKPFAGTVARSVLRHGTGGIHIDACRVPSPGETIKNHARVAPSDTPFARAGWSAVQETHQKEGQKLGRWPTNFVLSHALACRVDVDHVWRCVAGCPVSGLDAVNTARGERKGGGRIVGKVGYGYMGQDTEDEKGRNRPTTPAEVSKFFPQFQPAGFYSKPGTAAKSKGLDGERNPHPTVKSVDLMRWLIRLVTPPGGRVCDPFAGSGGTGVAAILEGMSVVLIEREERYVEITRKRCAHAQKEKGSG